MSFNSVTLIVASIIFVILLGIVSYLIYQDQKSKFVMVQSTCPDYWEMKQDASGNFYCTQNGKNIGTCSSSPGAANRPPIYTTLKSTNECDNYKRKMAWINEPSTPCVKSILWDGVTNNPQLRSKCK
jgi:hypothetical protein